MAGVFGRLDARGPSFAEPFPEHAPPPYSPRPLVRAAAAFAGAPCGVALAIALAAVSALPVTRAREFWVVLQEMRADFAMGSGLLCGFTQVLCSSDSADLGKC